MLSDDSSCLTSVHISNCILYIYFIVITLFFQEKRKSQIANETRRLELLKKRFSLHKELVSVRRFSNIYPVTVISSHLLNGLWDIVISLASLSVLTICWSSGCLLVQQCFMWQNVCVYKALESRQQNSHLQNLKKKKCFIKAISFWKFKD